MNRSQPWNEWEGASRTEGTAGIKALRGNSWTWGQTEAKVTGRGRQNYYFQPCAPL